MSQKEIKRKDAESLMRLGVVGAVGKAYVIRSTPWGGVISKYPRKSSKPPTQRQILVREKFARAFATAKEKLSDPETIDAYPKEFSNGESLFNKLVADSFKEQTPGRKKWWKWAKSEGIN